MAIQIVGSERRLFLSLSHDEIDTITKFLRIRTFVDLCSTCKELKPFIDRESYWKNLVKATFLPRNVPWGLNSDLLRSYCYKEIAIQVMDGLHDYKAGGFGGDVTLSVEAVSSVDREDEAGANVLGTSLCQNNLKKCIKQGIVDEVNTLQLVAMAMQRQCGCAGQFPCYWSSKPSATPDIKESMLLKLRSPLCAVLGFSLTPYRAYFHPSNPVYSPLSANLQFIAVTTTDGREEESVYFETPRFTLVNDDIAQEYFLPVPILCVGGMIRLVLHGMSQRQTILPFDEGDAPADGYYMCLSRVKIFGVPVFRNHDERVDYTNKSAINLLPSGYESDTEEDFRRAHIAYRALR